MAHPELMNYYGALEGRRINRLAAARVHFYEARVIQIHAEADPGLHANRNWKHWSAISGAKTEETRMSILGEGNGQAGKTEVDLKLEVVAIPVADVDRSKRFYSALGWRLDADFPVGNDFRVVQFTPPGSPTSIHFGVGITNAAPGSAQGLYLVVTDIEAARASLLSGGTQVSEIFHRDGPGQPAIEGRDPNGRSYRTYATFKDPDGNAWLLQEITQRLEGRQGTEITFASPAEIEGALRRAAAAHGEHEKIKGRHDENWPVWYADFIAAEQSGGPLPK